MAGPGREEPPKLSAGLIEKGRIAARGIASLFRSRDKAPTSAGSKPATTVVSPDTLRPVRVPPRQVETKKWPVLHVGKTPTTDLATWDLRFFGLVEEPARWIWDELRSLPAARVLADMHCVTHWTRLDNAWEGVLVAELMKRVAPRPEARFVVLHCEHGYTTNLPLADFLGDDCLFAWANDGRPLDPDHGAPLRLVVPRLYAWKSAKWVRGVEFLERDRPGFWEQNGYHNHGDPWAQERFS